MLKRLLLPSTRQTPREGMKSSAAPDDLFKTNKDAQKLDINKAIEFHNLVAKTLYATK
jgi:hypothetical protein